MSKGQGLVFFPLLSHQVLLQPSKVQPLAVLEVGLGNTTVGEHLSDSLGGLGSPNHDSLLVTSFYNVDSSILLLPRILRYFRSDANRLVKADLSSQSSGAKQIKRTTQRRLAIYRCIGR